MLWRLQSRAIGLTSRPVHEAERADQFKVTLA